MVKTYELRTIRSQALKPSGVMGAVHRLDGDGLRRSRDLGLRYSRDPLEIGGIKKVPSRASGKMVKAEMVKIIGG